jgi:hypothetical protein
MRRALLLLAGALLVIVPAGRAGTTPEKKLSAQELAAKIDEHIAARWKERKVVPAARADDAEWVRRATLDLSGRIPDILAARDFIDNPGADKRVKLIDKLLADERFASHWATVWRTWWLPDTGEFQNPYFWYTFEGWLRGQLKDGKSYDQMVRALLTDTRNNGPIAFYQVHQYRPENLASATSRLFLGVKLECAQCHNHPFARWKRQQFWELAAFFAGAMPRGFRNPDGSIAPARTPGQITIPGTKKTVKARFLDGKEPASKDAPREALLDWMVAKDNPYFARAAVNHVWEYLLGVGLVEPLAEEGPENPPSHPELLDLLARQFAANGYDLKYLIKAIALSRPYQLSSKHSHASQADVRLFGRMRVRGLSPEQMFDSLVLATGGKDDQAELTTPYLGFRAPGNNTPRAEFLRRFPNQDKRTEQQTSILQALYLMNGKLVADATSLEHNKNLAIIAEAKTVRTSRRVEQLFLITLSRKPTAAESARLVRYVDRGGPHRGPARALCDVFWALLNSSEFCSNH